MTTSNKNLAVKKGPRIEIRQLTHLNADEFFDLLRVFQQVFEPQKNVDTNAKDLRKLVDDPHFLVLVAEDGNRVIGGLTAHVLNNFGLPKPSVYLYDLAVLPAYQRQGIGKRLVAALIDYCTAKGYKEVFVQAEGDDAGAIDFYRKTAIGGEVNAMQFYYNLKDK